MRRRAATDSEQSAKEEFDAWLRKQMPEAHIKWKTPANDPPDFYLDVEREKYAVEVTDMMTNRTHQEAYARFVEEICLEASQCGILDRGYIVGFNYPISDWRGMKRKIRAQLLDYLRNHRALPDSIGSHVIKVNRRPVATVVPLAGPPRLLYPYDRFLCYRNGPDVTSPVEERVATKAEKLKRAGVTVPAILLIRDMHDARTLPEHYPSHVRRQERFHTIFIVSMGRRWPSFVLYSKDEIWASTRKDTTHKQNGENPVLPAVP